MPMGYTFIYNGISSDTYNASLVFLDESYTNRPSGSAKELVTTSIRRNPRQIYLDTEYSEVLTFNIEIVFDEPVDIFTFSKVKNWLSSPLKYCQLRICAENFANFYWNCIINLKEDLIYNGGYRGFTAEVQCDSPWAWQNETVVKYDLSISNENNIIFINSSESNEPLKPKIIFHMAEQGNFKINYKYYDKNKFMVVVGGITKEKNLDYSEAISFCQYNNYPISSIQMSLSLDKTVEFTDILKDKTVILDSEYGILTQNDDINIIDKFNKVFLKFPQGEINLTITGKADYVYFVYTNAIRFGGDYY